MARTKFQVEVLTPEGEVFKDEVEMVSTRTAVGSIGILANHTPILSMLDPAELRLYKSDSEVVHFAQAEGYMQMSGTHALILVEEAVPPGDLDVAELRERLSEAERAADRAGEDTEKQRVAQRNKQRLEAFLRIAGSE
jgi:F-type H+-transporting ATPase subunit epsilon